MSYKLEGNNVLITGDRGSLTLVPEYTNSGFQVRVQADSYSNELFKLAGTSFFDAHGNTCITSNIGCSLDEVTLISDGALYLFGGVFDYSATSNGYSHSVSLPEC